MSSQGKGSDRTLQFVLEGRLSGGKSFPAQTARIPFWFVLDRLLRLGEAVWLEHRATGDPDVLWRTVSAELKGHLVREYLQRDGVNTPEPELRAAFNSAAQLWCSHTSGCSPSIRVRKMGDAFLVYQLDEEFIFAARVDDGFWGQLQIPDNWAVNHENGCLTGHWGEVVARVGQEDPLWPWPVRFPEEVELFAKLSYLLEPRDSNPLSGLLRSSRGAERTLAHQIMEYVVRLTEEMGETLLRSFSHRATHMKVR